MAKINRVSNRPSKVYAKEGVNIMFSKETGVTSPDGDQIQMKGFAHYFYEGAALMPNDCFEIDGDTYTYSGTKTMPDGTDVAMFNKLRVPTNVSKDICRCFEDDVELTIAEHDHQIKS